MLDAKVLAAVLASLTAVAVGMDGSSVDTSNMDAEKLESEMNLPGDIEEVGGPIQRFRDAIESRPEPENEVNAVLRVKNIGAETFDLEGASLEMENFTSMSMEGKKVKSDEKIRLHGFSGSFEPGNETSIQGSVQGLTTSGVNISGTTSVEETISTQRISVERIERIGITLSNVEGSIESGDASTDFSSSRPLNINSFSGNMIMHTDNNTIVLDGKVDELESGSFSFGG